LGSVSVNDNVYESQKVLILGCAAWLEDDGGDPWPYIRNRFRPEIRPEEQWWDDSVVATAS
jgi:hypothetical protein